MFRVGIIGSGFMGTVHAAGWSKTPAKLAAVHSLEPNNAKALAEQYQAKVYDSIDSLLAAVDVVDICAPTHLHHQMVLQAAKAGKHIICEKPLARTLPQAKEMLAACQAAGVKLLVAHVVRFFPQYALAKTAVERGDIGKVAVLRLTRCAFRPKRATGNWFMNFEQSGGLILDLMIHDFDYARWVAGNVESVYAKSVTPNGTGEDYSLAILRHTNGALSNIEGAWAYPPPLFRTGLEIAGDTGLIEHPPDSAIPIGLYLKQTESGSTPDVGLPTSPLAEDPYTTELKHFYEVITGSIPTPRVTAEDGLAALQIALAAMQSAKTGRRILVEEVA